MAEPIEFPSIDPNEPMARAESAVRAVKLWTSDGGQNHDGQRMDINGKEMVKSELVVLGEKVNVQFEAMKARFMENGNIGFLNKNQDESEEVSLAKLLVAKELASESNLMDDNRAAEMLAIIDKQPGILDVAFVKQTEEKMLGVENASNNIRGLVMKFVEGEETKVAGLGENQREVIKVLADKNREGLCELMNGVIDGVEMAREKSRSESLTVMKGLELKPGELNGTEVLDSINEVVKVKKLVLGYKGIVMGLAWEATKKEIKRIEMSGQGEVAEVYQIFVDIVTPVVGEETSEELKVRSGEPLVSVMQEMIFDKLENGPVKEIWEKRDIDIVAKRKTEVDKKEAEAKALIEREEADFQKLKTERANLEKIKMMEEANNFRENDVLVSSIGDMLKLNPKHVTSNGIFIRSGLEQIKMSREMNYFAGRVVGELGELIREGETGVVKINKVEDPGSKGFFGRGVRPARTFYDPEVNIDEVSKRLALLESQNQAEFDVVLKAKIEALKILSKSYTDKVLQ